MRYLLDTNVISDQTRPHPDAAVDGWINERSQADLVLSAITFGEIQNGVSKLDLGRRRTDLTRWLNDLSREFRGRVLPVTVPVARTWGRLTDEARRSGRALQVPDGLLLATAEVHGLVVVTRDDGDFDGFGVEVINLWNR